MAKRRYHQSVQDRMSESRGMMRARMTGERLEHHREHFNDENNNYRDGERSGPYRYDRSLRRADDMYNGPYDRYDRAYNRGDGLYYDGNSARYDRSIRSSDDLYAGADSRRYREMADAGMIHEDRRAVANLPQYVVMKPYGDPTRYIPEEINDTIEGIDRQKGYDMRKTLEHFYPKKV